MPYELVDDMPRVDRSTLEEYAKCPLSARLSKELPPTPAMESGNGVHAAVSDAITEWLDDPTMRRAELADKIKANLRYSRPDIQPDVVRGGERAAWEIAGLFNEISPMHVLRYDGGTGKRSGQLSTELKTLPVIVTCEIDLLLATASKKQVRLLDWKSGWKQWTATSVSASFQFQFYPALVLANYPDVESVLVSILNSRTNNWTCEIDVTRDSLPAYMARIGSAASEWYQQQAKPIDNVPAWPGRDKCEHCRVASQCHAADRELSSDPIELVRTLTALQAKSESIEAILAKAVRDTGRDIETPDGLRYGFDKPKRATKPKPALYSVKTNGETDE